MSFPPHPPMEFLQPENRNLFAISIISDCSANSLRDQYQTGLIHHLPTNTVHRFGRCGDRELPGHNINSVARFISKYKFYFAFENTIQHSYVTEKLLFTLNIPILPVYYGCLNVPNITSIPSFIKASDFPNPKSLAEYLIYLNHNHEEYMNYHRWRFTTDYFSEDYLKILSEKIAGPEEIFLNVPNSYGIASRTAHCCRLCDENYVKKLARERTQSSFIKPALNKEQIQSIFFRA